VFDGNISGVTQVVNVGRPAAAQYAAKVGGGTTVVSSGGGGSTGTGGGSGAAITSSFVIANPDALLPNARLLAVSSALSLTDAGAGGAITIGMATPPTLSATSTNDAATGSHAISASAAPGAAESLLKSTSDGLLTLPLFTASTKVTTPLIDTASGSLTLDPTAGVVITSPSSDMLTLNRTENANISNVYDVGISYTSPGTDYIYLGVDNNAALRVFSAGDATLTGDLTVGTNTAGTDTLTVSGTAKVTTSLTTPLLTTATNVDLVINPAGTGAVQFPNDQTLRTSDFDSSFPIEGWQINEVAGISGYSALTIGKIQADELAVRVFVADEVRVDRGDEFWTKSYGIVAESFTTPGSISGTVSIMFEDSPALAGAIFTNNDWVLIRKLDIDTGITLSNIWGQVATYVNNSDGTQSWTFTLRSGPTSESVTKGSLAIDFGASGAALIHLSVIDAAGAPYIKMRKWSGANPYTPSNFTTYIQLGELGSTANAYVTPAGYGLYVRSTSDDSRFLLADDNGLQIRGASFKMYDGAAQTVDISSTDGSMKLGTDVSNSATTALDFDASTGDLSITGDLYTGKVYLLQASGLNTEQDVWGSWDNRRALQWWPDLTSMTGDPSLSMYTGKHSGGSFPDQNFSYIDANPTGGQLAGLWITAFGQGTGADAIIYLEGGSQSLASTPSVSIAASAIDLVAAVAVTGSLSVGGTAVSLDGHTHSYLPLSGGALSGTLTAQNITFATDNTYDIGAADKRVQDLYAVNLHVNSIVGTPSYSHNHAASDINSGTLDEARINHTWTGALTLDADAAAGSSNYLRLTTQTGSKFWDLIGRAHDYATSAQQNDLLLTYYDGSTTYTVLQADSGTRVMDFLNTPTVGGTAVSLSGHTHDDRYYTEAEVTSLLTGYVPTSRTVSAGSGLTGGGALSANITISHDDTSTQASVNNSGTTFIQDVTLDTYGHVTALGSVDIATALDALYVNVTGDTMTGLLTITSGAGDEQLRLDGSSATSNPYLTFYQDGTRRSFIQHNDTGDTLILASEYGVISLRPGSSGVESETLQAHGTGATVTGSLTASTSVITPTVTTASGNLSLTSVGGTVAVTGALTGSSTAAFTTSVSTPTVTTASGNLTLTSTGGTVAVTGAFTGSSTGVFTSTLTAASDTDAINAFGRVRLGYAVATDTASFAHFDQNTSANFALSQSAAGATTLNAASGQTVDIQVAGVSQWTASTARLNPRSSVILDIGDYNRRVRTLHAAELAVETLVAQNIMSTIGGRIIVAPTVKMIADLANSGTATSFNTNLAAYWSLDEASGNRSDSRGAQTLTDTNTVASTTGKQSSAANFTGSSSEKLNRSDSSTLSAGDIDFFFSLWIYPTLNSGSRMTLINKGSTGSGEYRVEIDWATSTVRFLVANAALSSTEVTSSVTITTNEWYFITAWHDSVSNVIGVGVNTIEATTAHTTGVRDSTGNFCLGARDTDQYYTGRMDEVGLWKNYIPSVHERQWLYNQYAGRTYAEINAQVQSTIEVDGNSLASGDFIYLSAAPGGVAQVESMRISSSASAITGGYRYTVVRDHDGSGLNNWYIGDAAVDIGGTTGGGYIDLTSTSTIQNHYGPTVAVYQRFGYGNWHDVVPTAALGNIRSFVDYADDTSGMAVGNDLTLTPSSGFKGLTADATNGLRLFSIDIELYNGATQTVNIDSAGTDIWVGPSSSDKRLSWNGTTLALKDSDVSLYSGGNKIVGINPTYGLDYKIGTSYTDEIPTITWRATAGSGNALARVAAYQTSGETGMDIRVLPPDSSHDGAVSIVAYNYDSSNAAGIAFETPAVGTTAASLSIYGNIIEFVSNPLTVTLTHGDLDMNGNDIADVRSITVAPPVGASAVSITTPTNQTFPGVSLGAANCGSSYGPFLQIGHNNNGSTPSAAWLRMYRRDGSTGDLWVDASGKLRIGAATAVTNATDTGGTVVGSQSSSLDTKHVIEAFTDYSSALNAIVDAPLYDFTYKSGAFGGQRFTGIVTDYAPVFGMDRDEMHPAGKSLNEVTAHGYTFAAIKALHSRIEQLENQVRKLTHA
jgi:hypothetical protein